MNQQGLAAFDQFIAVTAVDHALLPGGPPTVEGTKIFFGMFHKALPDLHIDVEDVPADGDKSIARSHFTGTHQGEFQGIAPTGKPVKVALFDMMRIAND